MKRDMDFVRMILMCLESGKSAESGGFGVRFYSQEELAYHSRIMEQGGLIETAGPGPDRGMPWRMTGAGHDFLELARNQTRWNRAKAIVSKANSLSRFVDSSLVPREGAPIEVWVKVLTDLMLQEVKGAISCTG